MEVLTRKEQEKKDRQAHIIKVAEKLIAESGFNETTMDQIAEAAEFAKGTIYTYFSSKEEILFEILNGSAGELASSLEQELRSVQDPLKSIRNLISIYLDFIEHNMDFFKIILVEQGSSCQTRKSMKRYFNNVDVFTEVFQKAIDAGQLQKCEPKLYAVALRGIIQSFSLQGVHDHTFQGPLSKYTDFIFETFTRGVLA